MNRQSRSSSILSIKKALVAGYPLIAITSWEENQVEATLEGLCKSLFPQNPCFYIWDIQNGLTKQGQKIESTTKLTDALAWVQNQEGTGFFVFKDLAWVLTDPEIRRRLRNISSSFTSHNRFLFLLETDIIIPQDLRKEIHLVEYGLPDLEEIQDILNHTIQGLVKRGVVVKLSTEQITQAAITLQGLTSSEVQHGLNKAVWGLKEIDESIITLLHDEKEQFTKKEGILEYFRPQYNLADLGGLQNLKEWLLKRKCLFSPEAEEAGLSPPRGLLMMGISGCGKSLSVKIISSLWNLPLFRLDMNQVYSGVHGTPEAVFHYAIKTMESVSPAILWIDEIEAGISGTSVKEGGTGSHIFAAFLTWMQEKSSQVFVAATANRIDLLPAEIIRKGRFDQVFFMDLPNDKEREEIFKVHLRRRRNNPDQFDLVMLSVATEFWNGAEIEHVIESGMIEAFQDKRKMGQDDLYAIIRSTVPLSRTMAEQIKFIKNWAQERAISASIPD